MSADLSGLGGSMIAIGGLVLAAAGLSQTIGARIRALAEAAGALRERVDGHESRICDVQGKVEGLGVDRAKLAGLEQRISNVETEMEHVSQGLINLNLSLNRLIDQGQGQRELFLEKFETLSHKVNNMRHVVEGYFAAQPAPAPKRRQPRLPSPT